MIEQAKRVERMYEQLKKEGAPPEVLEKVWGVALELRALVNHHGPTKLVVDGKKVPPAPPVELETPAQLGGVA